MHPTMQGDVPTGRTAVAEPADDTIRPIEYLPTLDRETVLREKPVYRFVKRVQDLLLASVALLVLAIPMGIVALAIWVDSPGGSPFFKQKRIGLDGREFDFYKFRSMVPNAEQMLHQYLDQNEMDGPVFKIRDDPRITRVGRFIRKTSIDELPQLINILRGDMSFVGPRPALPREYVQYGDYEQQRLFVVPGLTCYWQVQPRRNDLTFEEWMNLDVQYIRDRSWLLDWKLIFKTFAVVLHGEGV